MYLRHTTVIKNGKSHTYWRLVRSIRTGSRVRQQTVAQLGELDAAGRVRARALAEAIVGVERQPGLFEAPDPSESVTVELRRFRLERGRSFGDVWLGLRLWQALGLAALRHHQYLLRGRSRRQRSGPTRPLARSPPRLQTGTDRPGGHARWLPSGL